MSDYIPDFDLPLEVRQQQEHARKQAERQFEASQERAKAERKRREAEEAREAEEQRKREAQIVAEREEAARKQAAETKAIERERYIAAGGSPDDFEADYAAIRARLMAERMLERERRVAHPRDYMNDNLPGGTTRPAKLEPTTDNGDTE